MCSWGLVASGWLMVSGCNWVYGLDGTTIRDSGSSDTTPADVLAANCRVLLPSAVEQDSYLLDTMQHGVRSNNARGYDVNLVDVQHPGLFKFPIGGIAAGEIIAAAVMTVVVVDAADECGTGCASCRAHAATTYRLYWNRGDWLDGAATSIKRTASGSWDQPFAEGANDRSALVVEAPLAPGLGPKDLAIPMAMGMATPPRPEWLADGFVTIQLRTDAPDTAPLAIAADDRDESTCADGASKAVLTLTVCTP